VEMETLDGAALLARGRISDHVRGVRKTLISENFGGGGDPVAVFNKEPSVVNVQFLRSKGIILQAPRSNLVPVALSPSRLLPRSAPRNDKQNLTCQTLDQDTNT
jgi:hypothetical protein